jgi:hypothetical protein
MKPESLTPRTLSLTIQLQLQTISHSSDTWDAKPGIVLETWSFGSSHIQLQHQRWVGQKCTSVGVHYLKKLCGGFLDSWWWQPQHIWELSHINFKFCPPNTNFTVQRKQFPLHLAYAKGWHWIELLLTCTLKSLPMNNCIVIDLIVMCWLLSDRGFFGVAKSLTMVRHVT